jgi:hypothetical protein
VEKTEVVKQKLRYYLCQSALKTAIFFKSEKDFSNNHCINTPVTCQHYPDPDFVDQKYDSRREETV